MGKTTFSGPVRAGRRTSGTTSTFGHLNPTQKVAVSGVAGLGGTAYAVGPVPSCDLVEIRAVIQSPFAATVAAVTLLKVGTVADPNLFGQIQILSEGVYNFGLVDSTAAAVDSSALSAWSGIAEGTDLIVTVSAEVTALTSGRGNVYITYYQNSAATV